MVKNKLLSNSKTQMKEKYLSSHLTLFLKYGMFLIFVLLPMALGIHFILKNSEFLIGIISNAVGISLMLIGKNLKEVSFTSEQLIISDIRRKEFVPLADIKRLYKINVGTFYRIEYLNKNRVKTVDIWPSISLVQAINGELPNNFEEFLNQIK